MSSHLQKTPNQAILLVIAGPAGSGKSTLCDRMVKDVPGFSRVVTATTRAPREGEIHGTHYHFLSNEEFDTKLKENAFLEWAWVHKKNRYGTLKNAVLKPLSEQSSLVINVDVQGVENFRQSATENELLRKHMVTVYIDVPIEELRLRLAGRDTDSQEEIDRRMLSAELESREKHRFDHIIVSQSKELDFSRLLEIVKNTRTQLASD